MMHKRMKISDSYVYENKYKCKYRQIDKKYYTGKCQYLKRTKRINYYGSIHTGTDGII